MSFWLFIEWTDVRSASPALSSVSAWKSPSSRFALQFVPPVRGFFGERTQADGTIRMDITFRYALARQPG